MYRKRRRNFFIPANVQDDDTPPPIPAKTNKTSDTIKQTSSNDEEITGELTSPSLASTSKVEPTFEARIAQVIIKSIR